jgi:hypothetical protein
MSTPTDQAPVAACRARCPLSRTAEPAVVPLKARNRSPAYGQVKGVFGQPTRERAAWLPRRRRCRRREQFQRSAGDNGENAQNGGPVRAVGPSNPITPPRTWKETCHASWRRPGPSLSPSKRGRLPSAFLDPPTGASTRISGCGGLRDHALVSQVLAPSSSPERIGTGQ